MLINYQWQNYLLKEIPNIYEGRNSEKEIQLNLDYQYFLTNYPDLPLMVPFFFGHTGDL